MGIFKCAFYIALQFLQQVTPSAARLHDCFFKYLVAPRSKVAKRQVLQFAVGLVQTQTVGDRRINFQSLAADGFPTCARHRLHGAHIVRTVCQFDQNHPYITRHGKQHLAKRFNLSFFFGFKTQFV